MLHAPLELYLQPDMGGADAPSANRLADAGCRLDLEIELLSDSSTVLGTRESRELQTAVLALVLEPPLPLVAFTRMADRARPLLFAVVRP